MFSKKPWAALNSDKSHDGTKHDQHNHDDDSNQSLTTILTTAEDRASLLLLIAAGAESMRKNITDAFDPEQTGNPPVLPPRPTESDGVTKEKTAEEKQKEEQDAKDKEKREYERRVKELSDQKMQDLKTAALEYFDEWRDRVLERVGEALNEKPSSAEQQKAVATPAQRQQAPIDQHIDTFSQHDKDSISALHELYPPRSTPLADLDQAERVLILHSLLLLVLSLERYPAESRILLLQITSSLGLPLNTLTEDETKVARGLLEAAKKLSAEEETKKRAEGNTSRKWKVGLGAVAGATLIGVTGGLAAPFLAAGVGTVMGGLGLGTTAAATYLGALAGSAPLVGILFGAYGGSMTGKMVDQYAKDVQDFAFIPVRKAGGLMKDDKELRRLRIAIGISGWLTSQEDIVKPWQVIGPSTEAFALRWELEALMELGNALTTYIKSAAWGIAKTEIIKRTVFGALSAGLWPLALLKVSRVVDNPFSVARSRAEKVGAVLADALINKVQGERPVTLVGYSLGARAIYSCLATLADRKAFGLVESVVLAGAPTPSDSVAWRKMRSVVTGRLVNVYSANDYLLAFLYRTSSLQYGIAGLQPVRDVVGVENVDVSGLVDGHNKYKFLMGTILRNIGFEDVDSVETERQEKLLKQEEKKEEEEREERASTQTEEDEEALQREVDRKNKEGMMGWMSSKMSAIGIGGGGKDKSKQQPQQQSSEAEEKPPTLPQRPAGQNYVYNTDTGPSNNKEEEGEQGMLKKAAATAGDALVPGPG